MLIQFSTKGARDPSTSLGISGKIIMGGGESHCVLELNVDLISEKVGYWPRN